MTNESTNKKTILVVEDEASLLAVLRDKLAREGFNILEARNGEQGLELALSQHPDLILLDIILPVMDGMQMLAKLRADSWGKNAPVILLTNVNELDKVAEALAHGVHDYMVKADWEIEKVVQAVRGKLKT